LIRASLISFLCILLFPVFGQNLGGITAEEENILYARTKQVNQFFRRFNNEEDRTGKRFYPGDAGYRDPEFRKVYLNMLFDAESPFIQKAQKEAFIETVMNSEHPVFLDFHGGNWFAELATTFTYERDTVHPILFLQLEQENKGYKWVISNVYFDRFLKEFNKGSQPQVERSFLHPMSHELDFMNINKVFRDATYTEYYADKSFRPDYKSLFFYEVKRDRLAFQKAGTLKFHFFQVEGWYFEVAYFNRAGGNAGWLISKLYTISPEEKETLIQFYMP
jgi:hypothetical protein